MGRHSKERKAELLAQREAEERYQSEESDYETSTLQEMQNRQKERFKASVENEAANVKPKAKKAKKVALEDHTLNSQNGSSLALRRRKPGRVNRASKLDLIKLIQNLAEALTTVGDPEDVKTLLAEDDVLHADIVSTLHKNCHVIKTSLQHLGSIADMPDIPDVTVASTLPYYGKYVLYGPKESKLLYLLSVAEVFKANHSAYSKRKTLGFVRAKGTSFPLQCAISGWTNVLDFHPRMLDTEFWLNEVKYLAETLDHNFRSGCWDKANDREDGDGYASHVEPTLMLYYAYHLATKVFGIKSPVRKVIQSIWLLDKIGETFEAELVLSKAPCGPCKEFKQLIETFTGIKFTFVIMDNVAEVAPKKDKNGFDIYPKHAVQEEDHQEIIEALDMMLEYGATPKKTVPSFVVEIPTPPKAHTPKTKAPKPIAQFEAPDFHTQYPEPRPIIGSSPRLEPLYTQVVTTSKTVQKRKIQSFSYESPKKVTILDDSDDNVSEYTPASSQRSMSKFRLSHTSTPTRKTSTYTPPTPDSNPFSLEARVRAKEMRKKKRQAVGNEESPTAAKKNRWQDYRV
ncbi:uncharacterized protein LY89DRAFT_778216 [Mollisia scopiformis]|uniref:Single-strand DNA deaminase toxin A-like C-terminal domain-containing protein n=1 Tax=Mollisia scopiformis TaxID=149040 RepID=A0A194XNU1_MOLSC|nr:uncharacterized protein LY89DRAFT_778216 [Mollisia scopiformis]KUJ21843.1 hypothetical protein LY89DRAFT_778216 [Mollisia scopiformis]